MARTPAHVSSASAPAPAANRVIRDILRTGDPGYNRSTQAIQPIDKHYWPTPDPSDSNTTPTALFGNGTWGEIVSIRPEDCLDETEYQRYLELVHARAAARKAELDEIMRDPVLRYLHETREAQIAETLRRRKSGGYSNLTFRQILRSVQESWNHGRRPEIIINSKLRKEDQPLVTAGAMTFRGRVTARRTQMELNKIEQQAQDGTFQPLKEFPPELITAVIQRRMDLGIDQKQLARALCRKEAEVKNFEAGKLLFDHVFLAAINVWLNNTMPA